MGTEIANDQSTIRPVDWMSERPRDLEGRMKREEDARVQTVTTIRDEDVRGPMSSHGGPIDMDARARRRARSEDRPKITVIYCYDRSKIRINLSKSATSYSRVTPT